MAGKEPTTGQRVKGLEELLVQYSEESGKSMEELREELADVHQDVAHCVAMRGELARLTGTTESMATDVKSITREQIELRTKIETTLPFLATKEEVTKQIAICKDTQDGKRRVSRSPNGKMSNKVVGALVGGLVALTAVVLALIKFLPAIGG